MESLNRMALTYFDYLAAGASGLLSTSSSMAEHYWALDAVMRSESFVDERTKRNMLIQSKQQHAEWKATVMER